MLVNDLAAFNAQIKTITTCDSFHRTDAFDLNRFSSGQKNGYLPLIISQWVYAQYFKGVMGNTILDALKCFGQRFLFNNVWHGRLLY